MKDSKDPKTMSSYFEHGSLDNVALKII